ncbi:MAG: ABC transporter ATP-binding protein [Myxococcota bacterium]
MRRAPLADRAGRSGIELVGLAVNYRSGPREIPALRGVDLRVEAGELVCLQGRSGSGKSSLLRSIVGLVPRARGRIRVQGIEVQALGARDTALLRRRWVGMIFQHFNLLPTLSVAENVALPLILDRTRGSIIRRRVDALLEQLDLLRRRNDPPEELSGGEQQRVAIARALVIEPRVLLADEPTGCLDSTTGVSIYRLLRERTHLDRLATILVSHDPGALSFCDRALLLHDGRLTQRIERPGDHPGART